MEKLVPYKNLTPLDGTQEQSPLEQTEETEIQPAAIPEGITSAQDRKKLIARVRKVTAPENKNPSDMTDAELLRHSMAQLHDDVLLASKGQRIYRENGTIGGEKTGVPAWAQNITIERISKKTGGIKTSVADRNEVTAALGAYLDTNKLLTKNQQTIVDAALSEAERYGAEIIGQQKQAEFEDTHTPVPTAMLKPGDKIKNSGELLDVKEGDAPGRLLIKDGKTYAVDDTFDTVPVEGG